jgi:gamma-glutamylcyclotransferase (GGCT)/AIG2-like uncharacterized protein YtfP
VDGEARRKSGRRELGCRELGCRELGCQALVHSFPLVPLSAHVANTLSAKSPDGGLIRIFVYGTLLPEEPLWPALESSAASWERAVATGQLWDTGQGYPGVRFDAAGGPVPGVVVDLLPTLATEVLEALDEIEEEGRLYRRVEIDTTAGRAFAYEWLGATEGLRPLPDGWPARP